MTEILVTGGAGFIGSHITNYLIKHGHDVAVVDNLEIGKREYVNKYADFYCIDLRDRKNLDFLIKRLKPEVVVHAAAHAAEGQSVFTPIYTVNSNLIGFLNLFTSLLNVGFETIIFTSSMAVYGEQSFGDSSIKGGFSEDQPRCPVDPYGITKADIERLLEIYSEEFGFNYVTFRPHNVYGKNQSLTNPYRNVFGIWMNRIMNGLPPVIYGDGTQTRAFTHIDDCTKIIAESAWNPKAYGEIFNIGSDEVHTVNEACALLMDAMGYRGKPIYAPERPMEVKHAFCSQEKAKRILGYNPKTSLKDGLKKMAKWAKKQGAQPFAYWTEPFDLQKRIPKVWSEKQL